MEDKKESFLSTNIFVLCIFLLFLIVPRIGLYIYNIPEHITSDATYRYFPQAEKLDVSLKYFFEQTGPVYSLLLLLFKKITGDFIKGTVIFQHIIGIISGIILFFYLKRINLFIAFIIPIIVFCGPRALSLEHSILRESLCAFFLILFVISISVPLNNAKLNKFSFNNGFLVGLLGLILVLLRVEFIVIFFLLPFLIILITYIKKIKIEEIFRKKFVLWLSGYIFPIIIIGLIYIIIKDRPQIKTAYGGYFNIAYYMLQPEVYYYKDSSYPELLKAYQEDILLAQKHTGQIATYYDSPSTMYFLMDAQYKSTEKYLKTHPEIKLSTLQLMDMIYIEMMLKNTFVYFKSFAINFKNVLLTKSESNNDILFVSPIVADKKIINSIFFIIPNFIKPTIINKYLFWLFFLSFLLFVLRYKEISSELFIVLFVVIIQLTIFSWLASPTPRFRFTIDSFIYFVQIQPLIYLVASEKVRLVIQNVIVFLHNSGKKIGHNFRNNI